MRVLVPLVLDVDVAASTAAGAAEHLLDALAHVHVRRTLHGGYCLDGGRPAAGDPAELLPPLAEAIVDALAAALADVGDRPGQLRLAGLEREPDQRSRPRCAGAPPAGGVCRAVDDEHTAGECARRRELNRRGRAR